MSDDTGTSTEAATVNNGSGLSIIHMRAGLFGKSAATLNDESTVSLNTSLSEKGSSESTDNKLCNDDSVQCDEQNNEKEEITEAEPKLDESIRLSDVDDTKSGPVADPEEKENSNSKFGEESSSPCEPPEVEKNNSCAETTYESAEEDLQATSENNETEDDDKFDKETTPIPEINEAREKANAENSQTEAADDLNETTATDETGNVSNDENDSESKKDVIKTPGRRGRPPKTKINRGKIHKAAKADDEMNTEEATEESSPKSSPVGRSSLRLRNNEASAKKETLKPTPVKNKRQSQTPVSKTTVQSPSVQSTGRRGRPRKVTSSEVATSVPSTPATSERRVLRNRKEEEVADEEMEAAEEVEDVPSEKQDELDSDDLLEEEKPVKKRGRGSAKKKVEEKVIEPSKKSGEKGKRVAASPPRSPTPPRKRGRRVSAVPESTSTPKKSKITKVPSSAPPSRKAGKSNQRDPYDFSTEQETHPEPFKNIEMKLQSFGDVSYSRVGTGKYENTEKAAEARVSNLPDLIPVGKSKKSLAELTPRRKGQKKDEKTTSYAYDSNDAEDKEIKEVPTPTKATPGRKRKQQNPLATSTPKKSSVEAPVLDAEQLWTIDHPEDEHLPYEAGARVYAVFNKVFYPAVVLASGKDSLGRYKVQYVADKVVKDVPNEGVIPLRAVVAEKQCLAPLGSDLAEMQVIKSPNAACAKEWEAAMFVLSPLDDDGNCKGPEANYGWASINLDSADWRDYISKKSREVTQVLVDNIALSENRMSRRSRAGDSTKVITVSAKASTKKGKKNSPTHDMNEESYDEQPRESHQPIFSGKIFILTSAQRGTDGTGFKKKLMSEFIEQCHGVVVEDFSSVDDHHELEPFLISDTCYRTHKYLSAMARGVPCVSHGWIEKCRESNSLIDYEEFLLPAGQSILDNQLYPLPKNQRILLKDKLVLVHTNNRPIASKGLSFTQIWEPMVTLLGGTPITELPENPETVDIILTDASASPDLLELAAEKDLLVASSEWLIQGIIMDKLPNVDAHSRFRYDGGGATNRS